MTRATLSTKGQLIIPKAVRDRHGWDAGTELAIEEVADGVVIRALGPVATTKARDVVGFLSFRGRPRTLEEMERAIAAGASESR